MYSKNIESPKLVIAALACSMFLISSSVMISAQSLVPLPAKMAFTDGTFTFSADTVVVTDAASEVTARQLVAALAPAMGFTLPIAGQPGTRTSTVILREDPALIKLGKESYQLKVTATSILLTAPHQAGLFYGIQTLRQLLPVQAFSATPVPDIAWQVPGVTIEDQPRFAWRGLMLDCGHDFQNLAFVKRFIDLMALHKFNIFHWHLTDIGTWPIEIKGHPELLDGATRGPNVKPGHYSEEEIREVVRYAMERHITILPEIDMPGHATPALLAYPELYCRLLPNIGMDGKSVRPWEYCVGNEKTYAFLEDVLKQVADLFPGPYIHIGGDECPKGRWLRCRVCQAKMKGLNIKTGNELQSYFVKRMEKFLNSINKRMVGWDEIMEGGLAPDATVMSWRGMEGGVAAAKSGHDVIMVPRSWTYLDYPNVSVFKVYSFNPIAPGLTASESVHILGGEGAMWADSHPSERSIDAMVYPRAAALAEVLWTPEASRHYPEFEQRLKNHLRRLAALGINYKTLVPGVPVATWAEDAFLEAPKVMSWQIPSALLDAGRYQIKPVAGQGADLTLKIVEIVQRGKVIATGRSEGSDLDIHSVNIPDSAGIPLTLRITAITALTQDHKKKRSEGTIYFERIP